MASCRQTSLLELLSKSGSLPAAASDELGEESDSSLDGSDEEHEQTLSDTTADESSVPGSSKTIPYSSTTLMDESEGLLDKPNQPRGLKFPTKQFGKQKRSFNSKWFDNEKWSSWLHWDNKVNKAFCFMCKNVFILNQLTLSRNKEDSFIVNGFDNWKKATSAFEQHRRSKCHRESVMKWTHHLKGVSIKSQLDRQKSIEQRKNLQCLKIIFTSIEYLARQGLPFRGHDDHRGNFYQLIKLRASDSLDLEHWMERKKAYLSHEIQDEILRIMSHQVLRSILKDISASLWYSLMVDETVDASLTEQVL